MTERTVFLEALEIADPAQRGAYLDRACGGDADLRRKVQSLLDAHERPGDFLDCPAVAPAGTGAYTPDPGDAPARGLGPQAAGCEAPGTLIGPYKLLELIGEGGMGAVWMAEQRAPVRRRVALKVIKAGMDTRQVVARFEAERQALALMDHPNIARVFDGGATDSGRPYFVMELVKGVPLTRYCDDHKLTPRERLELFLPVCQAVQHAHQKGVIHRDLKPSNILVAPYDGGPVPKVIDFGIAKAAGEPLTEKTLFTGFGAVVGTPEYMSPEQAELNNQDIDTRSDVYSLGVLLYELLTGTTPLTRQRVKEGALLEVLRLVREEEPPRPSTRLSTTAELPTIAANRGLEPKKLSGVVRGELDWIVMKALEKDRGRRYETANGFARDIQRHLADEPVEACPPSAGYRLRKFARRNRKSLTMASAFVLLLVAAAAVSTWQAIRATRAETKARQAQTLAEERFNLAQEAVDKYLNEITEDPELKGANFETLRKKLLETALPFYQKLAEQAPGDAEQGAAMGQAYFRLASIRAGLGQHAAAVQDYEVARDIFVRLADARPHVPVYRSRLAEIRSGLGYELAQVGKRAEAEAECRTAIEDQKRLADEQPNNLEYRQRLAACHMSLGKVLHYVGGGKFVEAEAEYRIAIKDFQRLADEYPNVAMYRHQLGDSRHCLADAIWNKGGDLEEAEDEYRAALHEQQRVTSEHPNVAIYRFELALNRHALGNLLLLGRGKLSQAETEFRVALKDHQRLADAHPKVPDYRNWLARCHRQLGLVLDAQGKMTEAEIEYRAAIKGHRPVVQESPDSSENSSEYRDFLAQDHLSLGRLLAAQGKRADAEAEYREAIRLKPDALQPHQWLGELLAERGQWEKASTEFVKATECNGADAYSWYKRAMVYLPGGNLEGYRKTCSDMLERFGRTEDLNTLFWLAWTCILASDAVADAAEPVRLAEKAVTKDSKNLRYRSALGAALYRAGRFDDAARQLMGASALEPKEQQTAVTYTYYFLAMTDHRLGHTDEARRWLDKATRATEEALKSPAAPPWNRKVTLQLLRREAEELIQRLAGTSENNGPQRRPADAQKKPDKK